MTNTHGAITEAIEALDKISKTELKVTTCPNVAYLKLSENKNIAKEALTKLQALSDATEQKELYMAVHGGKDTQESRKIKHYAAKLLADACD